MTIQSPPAIIGVAQVAQYVGDIDRSRSFYSKFLGFDESHVFSNPDGTLRAALIKIDECQSVQLIPKAFPPPARLSHFGLETDNTEAMRLLLKSRGITVPEQAQKGRFTAYFFSVKDPDGNNVEFMQFGPESWTTLDFGKHLPATRVASHLRYIGIRVCQLDRALTFYRDKLGCIEVERGGNGSEEPIWVNLRVPNGTDLVRLIVSGAASAGDGLNSRHEMGFLVRDLAKTAKILASRALDLGAFSAEMAPTGTGHKERIRTTDPDGTHIEMIAGG